MKVRLAFEYGNLVVIRQSNRGKGAALRMRRDGYKALWVLIGVRVS